MRKITSPFAAKLSILNALENNGLLLNTNGEKFNSMVIGWAGVGTTWGRPTVTVYVRENRYTKAQIDRTGEFTLSVPEKPGLSPEVMKICGGKSGREIDKAAEAGFTLTEPEVLHTPGIEEFFLTAECRVLYSYRMELSGLPEDIRASMYPQDVDGTAVGANRDPHTAYVAEIVSAYYNH